MQIKSHKIIQKLILILLLIYFLTFSVNKGKHPMFESYSSSPFFSYICLI